ncbi:MAG: response regulator transcription factor [Bacteroidales bacterium]|nr:response regulator transcription factor [Bacteroidales bacterium]MBN2761799.1 response regulator transcription factor [Bacteroidales bacterium]
MKCLVVDDEPLAQQIIEDFIKRVPFLEFSGKCSNAMDAISIMQKIHIDLLFLDINMPEVTGIEMMASLPVKPLFILTTAYSEYALESYALNTTDYLLKPIPFERFLTAVNKAYEIHTLRNQARINPADKQRESIPDHIFVRADYQTVRVNLDDIQYIEGLKDYVRIHLVNRKSLMTLQTMKNMVELLPRQRFIRIHKSYIINLNRIDAVERNRVLFGDKRIPVGEGYKEEFLKRIKTGA